jgi:SET domain-containing protein
MLLVKTKLVEFPIKGIGVILLEPVKRGTLIWRFDSRIDRVYSVSELQSLPAHLAEQIRLYATFNKAASVWVLGGDHSRFFNHSYNPTTLSKGGSFGDDYSAKDLDVGEELTSNYDAISDSTPEQISERRTWTA